jgi:Domain of unknown function (DUF1707)/Cell wall-active antibiotics response 4TMS YvqF
VSDTGGLLDESAQLQMRASDEDRRRVVDGLREHLVAGRLTLDEFSERVDRAHAARTVGELEAVTGDLPPAPPSPAQTRKPKRWTVAVMGELARRSRWRVAEHAVAIAVMGSCTLDLRKAEIESGEIEITAIAFMGSVDVVVPEGLDVEVSGFAVMGSRSERVADAPPLRGSPLVHVRAVALMGDVTVRSKPRSRGHAGLGLPPLPSPPGTPRMWKEE